MPSPHRPSELSPEMRARYGLDRSTWRTKSLVVAVIAVFLAGVAWATVNMGSQGVQYRLLTWSVTSPNLAHLEFEVRNSTSEPALCVVRAQDSNHIDVGYSTVTVPAGREYVRVPYDLATLAPAFAVELLGCAVGEAPRVTPSNFPPGVAPPQQQ